MISVQTLKTMNKLKEINGYVSLTLDKLPGVSKEDILLGLIVTDRNEVSEN